MATHFTWAIGLLIGASVVSCGACGGSQSSQLSDTSEPVIHEPEPTPTVPAVPIGPRPEIEVRVDVDSRDSIQIRIEGHGEEPAVLSSTLSVERKVGETWAPITTELFLRSDCDTEVPDCVTLIRGAELRPPIWRGMSGQGQCACEICIPLEAGEYRVVAKSCDQGHSIESESFAL